MQSLARNIPLFLAFRVLFNARFYYPVLGVLFVDLGLTLAQYAILNAVWAAAILLLEIPSGALADAIGRRRMVILAALLMVIEMALFAFAPAGPWLFWILVANRILSGAAEASASGADEALAYDSLPEAARAEAWPGILAQLVRWQSGAFVVAMLAGAALFDQSLLTDAAALLGVPAPTAPTTRWPVYATLGTSILCLAVALAMREAEPPGRSSGHAIGSALRNIGTGARMVFSDRRIILLLATALVCDSAARLFVTFVSNYNRLIGLPEAAFGIVGAAMGLLGFATASLGPSLVARSTAPRNFLLVVGAILLGLTLAACAIPLWGVLVMVPIGIAMQLTSFFTSHYLNAWVDSDVRATVLSFRGVALNVGYGSVGLAFAALLDGLARPGSPANDTFHEALFVLPPAFLAAALLLGGAVILARRATRSTP
jgi:MFS family permease